MQPKGIIALALPKSTPKGWKAGKKVTGLEVSARCDADVCSRLLTSADVC
jgi:hypothetical protein